MNENWNNRLCTKAEIALAFEFEEKYMIYVVDYDKLFIFENLDKKLVHLDFQDSWMKRADMIVTIGKKTKAKKKVPIILRPNSRLASLDLLEMPESTRKRKQSEGKSVRPQKQPKITNKWEVGRVIVVNPPPDLPEKYWLAKITKKVDRTLTVQWFDKKSESNFAVSSTDDIPCESVYEDLNPILNQVDQNTWRLENGAEIEQHVAKYR